MSVLSQCGTCSAGCLRITLLTTQLCLIPMAHHCPKFATLCFCCCFQNAHNVMVSSSPTAPYGLVAKIADLGLSRIIKQQATHRTTKTASWHFDSSATRAAEGWSQLTSSRHI
eukprot:GHUV01046099.1.p1 GENE.GHUV01046099.1~~GHUV01046099.1.p1  ORF type:complete len:113 (+),score=26.00 GHUV01046099.1:14-352(+)